MSPPAKEPAPLIAEPAPSNNRPTNRQTQSSGLIDDLGYRLLAMAARLPYWIPTWLDRLALHAAKRLGREGKL